jgi:hypothetical protein
MGALGLLCGDQSGWTSWTGCRFTGTRLVDSFMLLDFAHWQLNLVLPRFTTIACFLEYERESAKSRFVRNPTSMIVIPNAIDPVS